MIEFNGRYRFIKMPLNILVEKRKLAILKNGTQKYIWKFYGYFGTIKSALLDILNDMIIDEIDSAEQVDLKDLIRTINKSENEIVNFCNNNKEIFSIEIHKIKEETD